MFLRFLFFPAFIFLKGNAQGVTAICSNEVEVSFKLELIRTTSVSQYRLERNFRTSDQNCFGSIAIIGENGDDTSILLELGSDVFQKLPLVEEINLAENYFGNSNRDMYTGSPNIETMNFLLNGFSRLDANTQFPVGLKKLDVSGNYLFSEVKTSFFANHESLIELDISSPSDVAEIFFEEGVFQTAMALEKIIMNDMPVSKLKQSLLSNHAASLKHVDMSRWQQLTSVEYNAFSGVSLEMLDLSEWPFLSLDVDLFSGASIKKLFLQRSKLTALKAGSFTGLKESQEINLLGSEITSIESGSFRDFTPLDDFKLTIPNDISCCNLDGLVELLNVSNGISINNNLQNYTCFTPDKVERVMDILLNEDPSFELSCCDYEKEFYDNQKKSCEECQLQNFCSDNSNSCKGEETNFLTCDKCNVGYAANPFECQECQQSQDCKEASSECSLAPGYEMFLKCNKCADGLAPDPDSGICVGCLELSPACVTYDSTCVVDTQKLACKICNDDTELIEGNCVSVEDLSLPLGVIIGISVGSIVVITLISIIVLRVCLRRRKKRKERKLLNSCGIYKNESGVELHAVEFDESESSRNAPHHSEHLQIPESNFDTGSFAIDDEYVQCGVQPSNSVECIQVGFQLTKSDPNYEKPVQVGAQLDYYNIQEGSGLTNDHSAMQGNGIKMIDVDNDDDDYVQVGVQKEITEPGINDDYVELGVQKETAEPRMPITETGTPVTEPGIENDFVELGVQKETTEHGLYWGVSNDNDHDSNNTTTDDQY